MLGYLDEIESDFSRFHRVDDPMSLPSSRYFRLAPLLVTYDGALTAALRRDLRPSEAQQPSPTNEAPANMHVASSAIPTYEGETLAAMTDGPGEFPGIEYTGG